MRESKEFLRYTAKMKLLAIEEQGRRVLTAQSALEAEKVILDAMMDDYNQTLFDLKMCKLASK